MLAGKPQSDARSDEPGHDADPRTGRVPRRRCPLVRGWHGGGLAHRPPSLSRSLADRDPVTRQLPGDICQRIARRAGRSDLRARLVTTARAVSAARSLGGSACKSLCGYSIKVAEIVICRLILSLADTSIKPDPRHSLAALTTTKLLF